jgi:hypothetical protein
MRKFRALDEDVNIDQIFRKHWFRYRSFDGFRWHYTNSRDHPRADFWVILKQTPNQDGWIYCVKGSNGMRKVAIQSLLFPDPQLAAFPEWFGWKNILVHASYRSPAQHLLFASLNTKQNYQGE